METNELTADFLTEMAALKQAQLARLKREVPLRALKRSVREAPPARPLLLPGPFEGIAVLAEVKRASPSAGDIRPDLNPVDLAVEYAAGGAAAISVLTEPHRFKGSPEDLVLVRSRVDIPVLRKDFIIDTYDLYRTRGLGADLVLLIVAMLPRGLLERMIEVSLELGLTPLVEVHSESDVELLRGTRPPLIGVNNRDLKSLIVAIETSFTLAPRLLDSFPDARLVSESGIDSPHKAARLAGAGYSAVLVGEYLVRAADRRRAVADLVSAGTPARSSAALSIRGNQS